MLMCPHPDPSSGAFPGGASKGIERAGSPHNSDNACLIWLRECANCFDLLADNLFAQSFSSIVRLLAGKFDGNSQRGSTLGL